MTAGVLPRNLHAGGDAMWFLWALACDKPDMISADVWFDAPDPDGDVCREDLDIEVGATTSVDHMVDLALLAWWGDMDEEDDSLGAYDEDEVEVLHLEAVQSGQQQVQFDGALDWGRIDGLADGRVLLSADVGAFDGALAEGQVMDIEAYDQAVAPGDVYARATTSVRVCGP